MVHTDFIGKSILIPFTICFLFISVAFFAQSSEPKKSTPELVLNKGLISCYYFNKNARDTFGSNHGTVRGASLVKDRFGNERSAYSFDGQDDFINLGNDPTLKKPKMSFSLWIKITSAENNRQDYANQPFICTRSINRIANFESYFIGFHASFQKIDASNSTPAKKEVASVALYESKINDWYHIVYMFDNDSTLLYVNDVLQEKKPKQFITTYLENDSVIIGYIGNNFLQTENAIYSWLNGCVDDIRIYDRMLNESEIQALYKEENPNASKQSKEQELPFSLITWIKDYWFVPFMVLIIIVITVFLTKWRLNILRRKEREKAKVQQQLSQMEMQALRSQMNPHFIFNTLNSIQHYVLTNEKELANKYLVKFSSLMRNVLELSKKELISLQQELETVRLFLEIESLRFENAFNYSVQIADEADISHIQIPPLIIQPFVENAIWHGLLSKDGEKELIIRVSKQATYTLIEIDDNGIGRKAAQKPKENGPDRKSLGMEITQSRLKTLESATGIHIEMEIIDKTDTNAVVLGTKVILKIHQSK